MLRRNTFLQRDDFNTNKLRGVKEIGLLSQTGYTSRLGWYTTPTTGVRGLLPPSTV